MSLLIAWVANIALDGSVVPWDLVNWASFVAVPVLCGRAVGVHRRQAEQLRTLTARLERERAALARLAVVEERTRVARDLHDTIAHGLSIMVLQAGGAEQVLTRTVPTTRCARSGTLAGPSSTSSNGCSPCSALTTTVLAPRARVSDS